MPEPTTNVTLTVPATPTTATTVPATPTTATTAPPTTATPPVTGDEGKVVFTSEQQAEINRIAADARKEGRRAAETAATEKAEAEKLERERLLDIEKGEFGKVRTDLEKERDEAKAAADARKERLDALMATVEPGVTAAWTDLPEEVRDLYTGADDDILAKAAHLERTKALVARLTATTHQRTPLTPRPQTPGPAKIESPVSAKQITG